MGSGSSARSTVSISNRAYGARRCERDAGFPSWPSICPWCRCSTRSTVFTGLRPRQRARRPVPGRQPRRPSHAESRPLAMLRPEPVPCHGDGAVSNLMLPRRRGRGSSAGRRLAAWTRSRRSAPCSRSLRRSSPTRPTVFEAAWGEPRSGGLRPGPPVRRRRRRALGPDRLLREGRGPRLAHRVPEVRPLAPVQGAVRGRERAGRALDEGGVMSRAPRPENERRAARRPRSVPGVWGDKALHGRRRCSAASPTATTASTSTATDRPYFVKVPGPGTEGFIDRATASCGIRCRRPRWVSARPSTTTTPRPASRWANSWRAISRAPPGTSGAGRVRRAHGPLSYLAFGPTAAADQDGLRHGRGAPRAGRCATARRCPRGSARS